MLKLSPCIEMFWPETDFAARIGKAAGLGFEAYEFWAWWNKDLDAVERATKDAGLAVSACCVNTASPTGGPPPLLVQEGKEIFVNAVRDCIPVSGRIGCTTFIATTGNELKGVPRESQHAACVAALKAAAPVAEDAGITLVLEPLNLLVDHAGYYLSTSAEGFAIVDEVGSPAVKLLFDIYHQQITEGNVTRNITANIGRIGHFHVANNPGRYEPASGEIDYPFVFDRIREMGYDRYVGLEFRPSDPADTDNILRVVRELA